MRRSTSAYNIAVKCSERHDDLLSQAESAYIYYLAAEQDRLVYSALRHLFFSLNYF
jgi:hypothetical protein